MIGVNYCSAAKNPSGYGSAARQYITSLFVAGVNITCETISQMSENTNYGLSGNIRELLENRDIPYKIKIIHLTPDLIPKYKEDDKYNIAHLFWECSRLPNEWIEPLNSIQEIWTASEPMAKMIADSGVTTKISCFPQPIDVTKSYENIKPFQTEYEKDFVFYSIFQWIERKNPKVLLQAYWKEFEGNDDITLLIKTYRITYLDGEYQLIKNDIREWKNQLGLKHYPKIFLVHKLLTDDEMYSLHKMGNCFVNPSSGEGWNRPIQEALLIGNPVISGDNGGITDVMNENDYYKVKSHIVQATQQPFIPWYTSDMQWKELDEKDLQRQMRNVYEGYIPPLITNKTQQYVINNFSYQKIGEQMKKRLEEIYAEA